MDKAGGDGTAVSVDHADDRAVEERFARVGREQGRLDILVINAAKRVSTPSSAGFWEHPWKLPRCSPSGCDRTMQPATTRLGKAAGSPASCC